jgi:histidinol-phosphate aminotransferase
MAIFNGQGSKSLQAGFQEMSLDFAAKHLRDLPPISVDRPLGPHVVQMGMNENPFGPSPLAVDAMQKALDGSNRYPDDTGYELRQKLADRFKVSTDEVIVGVGVSDLLGIAFNAVLSPGAEVLTSEGSFVVYYLLAASTGMHVECVPLKNYSYDLEAIARRINSQTRLILIANPNNPTGTIVQRKEFEKFLERVPSHVLLVMDEAYFEYVDLVEYPDSMEYLRSGKSILTLRTFSKVYGLAGVRLGYGIAQRDIIETLYKVRMTYSVSAPGVAGGLAALEDVAHVEKSVRLNHVEREFLAKELAARGIKYIPSVTNFILLDLGRPAAPVAERLLEEAILVRPAWGIPNGLRVSVGPREHNKRFLNALEKVL